MSAWGKTGRVTIRSGSTRGVYNDIHVDGEHVGNADHLPSGWQARAFDGKYGSAEAPSLDAAVLWVLRRVDPALWRQERGEVVTVRRSVTLPSGCPSHYAWRFYGGGYIHYSDFPTAVRAADRYARTRHAEVLAS